MKPMETFNFFRTTIQKIEHTVNPRLSATRLSAHKSTGTFCYNTRFLAPLINRHSHLSAIILVGPMVADNRGFTVYASYVYFLGMRNLTVIFDA